ncbi:unnamed protein product [Dovyalis caffra]|uniref:Uncharacterized protein n=1 Tax=Dovyalis caffra TaxID=77055 RepID=A0AAV1RTC9_9ROSI|nr:unnamed protein product [Dovyalis caffra]
MKNVQNYANSTLFDLFLWKGGYIEGAESMLDHIKCETELDYSSNVSIPSYCHIDNLDIDQIPVYESIDRLKSHLNNFMGISRCYQMIGHAYDDYAPYPKEVCAALQAAHQMFQFKSLLVVFQPLKYRQLP